MWFVYLCLFIGMIWLPAQWANGATFMESIAPNEPLMAIFWLIVLFFIFFPLYMKFRDEGIEADKAKKQGLVDKNASTKDAASAYRDAQFEERWKCYGLEDEYKRLYWEADAMMLDAIRRKKAGTISEEEVIKVVDKYHKMMIRRDDIVKYLEAHGKSRPYMGL